MHRLVSGPNDPDYAPAERNPMSGLAVCGVGNRSPRANENGTSSARRA